MRIFRKSKKKSSCCNIQFEEFNNDEKSNETSECSKVNIEEVKPKSTKTVRIDNRK